MSKGRCFVALFDIIALTLCQHIPYKGLDAENCSQLYQKTSSNARTFRPLPC